MTAFEKIENVIVLISRGILIVLSLFTFIIAIVAFIYGLNLALSKETEDDFRPMANIEKFDETYITPEDRAENIEITKTSNAIPNKEIEIAKKIQRNLAANFKNQADFSRFITTINSYEFRLLIIESKEDLGVDINNETYLLMMLELSTKSQESYVLERVSRYDDVEDVLFKLIAHLSFEIYDQYNDFERKKFLEAQKVENNRNLGYNLLLYSSAGIGVFVIIILYIILFKIEINIRKISEKIKS